LTLFVKVKVTFHLPCKSIPSCMTAR